MEMGMGMEGGGGAEVGQEINQFGKTIRRYKKVSGGGSRLSVDISCSYCLLLFTEVMVTLFWPCPTSILLLLTTALVAIHGYRQNPTDEETAILGYRIDEDTNLNIKRDPTKNLMWIGPRLGRRKRSEEENNVPMPEKTGGTVVEFLQDSPWAFVALKGGKRRTVNFIPRLGRDSEEEYGDTAMDGGYGKSNSRSGSQVSGPFGGSNNFTPRLGRFTPLFARERL